MTWWHDRSSVDPATGLVWRAVVPSIARRADRVLTYSEAAKADIVSLLGIASERVDSVPLGRGRGAPAEPMPEPELRARYDLGRAAVVLAVSGKRPSKNLARLVEAFAQVTAELPEAILVMPGAHTRHEDELRALAGRLGVASRIRFLGYVSAEELEGLYQAARCFVFPSLYEGFGLPVLEAMRRGVPVACSRASACPRWRGTPPCTSIPTTPATWPRRSAACSPTTTWPPGWSLPGRLARASSPGGAPRTARWSASNGPGGNGMVRAHEPGATPLARATDPEQFRLTPSGPGSVLDVGCGSKKYPGAVGVDVSADTDADVVLDLDRPPYDGLETASFDQVLCQDVLEHVAEPVRVMEELHRVTRPGGRIHVRTPHFSSVLAYGDPTHRHYFSTLAVRSLAEPGFAHYTPVRMRVVRLWLDFWTPSAWSASPPWPIATSSSTSATSPSAFRR